MTNLAQLDPPKATGLIVHILQAIAQLERKIRPQQLLMARYYSSNDIPRLKRAESTLQWDFELQGVSPVRGQYNTSILFDLDTRHLSASVDDPSVRVVRQLSAQCSCTEEIKPCVHQIFCLHYLRRNLSQKSTDDAMQWMESCITDGRHAGKKFVESLDYLKVPELEPSEEEPQERERLTRIQWRVAFTQHSVRINPYLQTMRKRGGWNKGRLVRESLDTVDETTLSHASDRTLVLLLQAAEESYRGQTPRMIRECFKLLYDHPNVTLDDENQTPIRIRECPLEVRVEEESETYRPSVFQGDYQIVSTQDAANCSIGSINNNESVMFRLDRDQRCILVSTLDQKMKRLIDDLQMAERREAVFDQETAERFADLVAAAANPLQVQINLPERLAGPEQPLEPNIELHLSPFAKESLMVSLRVACDLVREAPVPGMEPDRLRVATAAGRFQLLRALEEEAMRADEVAGVLELGRLSYESPYTWIAETPDEALDLIQRIQQLGEDAPTVCWPKSQPMRIIGEITPQRLQVRLTSQRDWFGVEGVAQLEGLEIPLAELLAALRGGRRFVPLGDGQFAMISEQLRQRLNSIQDVSSTESGQIRVSRAATAVIEEALGTDITYEADSSWRDALDRLRTAKTLQPKVPENLMADLREYQKSGYSWLARLAHWGIGGCLADDMGLGKTVQTLGVLLDRSNKGAALIIAPTSVGSNWQREAERFAPSLKPKLYREHDRQTLIDSAGPGDLIITSYQLLQRDVDRFTARSWYTLVLDEAQFIKNFQTKTAQAVRQLDADWRIALSGTPLENHLGELWSLMRTVSPGLLGSWDRFRKNFAEPIERQGNRDRLQALGRVVRPFILRRTKKEVLSELPERTEVVRYAELSTEERKKYDSARLAAINELTQPEGEDSDSQMRIRVLAWLTRLRQLSCHPALVDKRWTESSAKLDLFMEIVEELREGEHRALVFSQFVQHLSLLREALDKTGVTYQYLDGSTPAAKRQEAVDRFQAGEGDLFLISLKAGGTGLNLTAADYVIHMDPWWNPAVEDQATDRAHRIGQQRAVTVYRLVAKDTIEQQILALHADKRELISGVLDGADRAGRMSTDELVSLIRLSQVETV
ncbi:ATP-dependent helicase HepA [Pirellula sp. SH-Sr6A]|uniref:DEAD/DEAH box helicase n=1 Tax=Pirellula sp. SH-Sr6A TaxID=1632865 RepID=UPI00078EF105|nr:DEAD/DEAH box helicase [Pirellula sp. SH-Sr6A]AMV35748.1 ATP-dependent helicase HepA [Pirellula sp. SH-Sr6A]